MTLGARPMALVGTANNRPEYLEATLQSWQEAQRRSLGYVRRQRWFSEPGPCHEEVADLIKRYAGPKALVQNEEQLGPLENPYHALSSMFFDGYTFVILAEDDSLVSRDVISYFGWASREFVHDEHVLAVCSYVENGEVPPEERRHTELREWFSPTVWGTWADRWWNVLEPSWDHDYSTGDGHEAGWDWNIRLRVMPQGGFRCLFPMLSRSRHIGREDGAHMLPEMFDQMFSPVIAGEGDHAEIEGDWTCVFSSLEGPGSSDGQ